MRTRLALSSLGLFVLSACGQATSGSPGLTAGAHVASLVCEGSPAPAALDRGLCVCGDLRDVGGLVVEAGRPGGSAAAGVNGKVDLVSDARIEGGLVAFGGLTASASVSVGGDLATGGDLELVGALAVGGDLLVGGDLRGVGDLSVAGAARVAGEHDLVGSDLAVSPLTTPIAEPCGCDPSTFVDVAAIVGAAATANENAGHGLTTHLGDAETSELTLDTGSYYFDDAARLGALTLHVEGTVFVHLAGDLDFVGDAVIDLAPGATLDLYVAGNVRTVGSFVAGGDPSAFRLLVGGAAPISMGGVGEQSFRGAIYAPSAHLEYVGDTTIEGSVFAAGLDGVGQLTVRQWSPVEARPASCDEPAPSNGIPNL